MHMLLDCWWVCPHVADYSQHTHASTHTTLPPVAKALQPIVGMANLSMNSPSHCETCLYCGDNIFLLPSLTIT